MGQARTETTSIRPDERNLENLELQDALDTVSQVFPFAEVVSKLPIIQAKTVRKITRESYPMPCPSSRTSECRAADDKRPFPVPNLE